MKGTESLMITSEDLNDFARWLHAEEREKGTIEKYMRDVRNLTFWLGGREISKEGLTEWKEHLLEEGKAPATVNSMIAAVNTYCRYKGLPIKIRFLRIQRNDYEMEATVTGVNGTPITTPAVTIKYYKEAGCTTEISNKPTDAGTYYAKAEFAGNTNYKETSWKAEITINKATPTVSMNSVDVTYGTDYEMEATVTGVNGTPITTPTAIIKYYKEAGCTTEISKPTDAGTYYARAEFVGNDNYTAAEQTATITINKAVFTVTVRGYEGTYDGKAHSISVSSTEPGVTVTYATSEAGEYSETNPSFTEVGTYTVYYKAVKDNYNDVTGSATVKINQQASSDSGSSSNASPVTVDAAEQALLTTPKNVTVSVVFQQDGITQKLLPNTGVRFYAADGKTVVTEARTDAYGALKVTLTPGKYYYQVFDAPAGYPADGTLQTIWINYDKDTATVLVQNSAVTGNSAAVAQNIAALAQQYAGAATTAGTVKDITGTVGNDLWSTKILNGNDLASLLGLTNEEIAQGVNVWIEATDASASVSDADKALIDAAKGDDTVGVYLDFNLYKKVGSNAAAQVHQLNGRIKVSFVVPENLRKSGRTYEIIRVHDGVVTVIPATYDEATGTVTFETDQFSSYALAFKDAANGETAINAGSVATGDNSDMLFWIVLVFAAIAGISGLIVVRRKHNK